MFINHVISIISTTISVVAYRYLSHGKKIMQKLDSGKKYIFGLCRKLHIRKAMLTNCSQIPPTRQFQSIYRILLRVIGIPGN